MQTLEYTTVDKSEWGDGPWQQEPDKIQWEDKATGLPCLIKRGPSGALCGYVGVLPGHPLHGVEYHDDKVPGRIEGCVHGGLTYSDFCQDAEESEGICHLPAPGEPENVWWFGFDCAHGEDYMPAYAGEAAKYRLSTLCGGTYKPLSYVQHNVRTLAKRLSKVG